MIFIAGLLALLIGLVMGIYVLWVLGIILLIVAAVLWFVPVGGRTHRWR